MTNISDKVFKKIKEKHIAPKSRWSFLLKNYSIWVMSVLSLMVGGLAFSVIIFLIKNNDWDVYEYLNDSLLYFILLTLPYFWVAFLILFILAANYNFKHTKRGYKYKLHTIVIGTVFLSVLLGVFLYHAGMGRAIDDIFVKKMPFYKEMFRPGRMRWISPEQGFLAGKINSVADKNNFSVLDLDGREWSVLAEESAITPMVKIQLNEHVRMVGEKSGEDRFRAERIFPARSHMRRWFRDMPPKHMINKPPMRTLPFSEQMPEEMRKIHEMRMKDMEKIGVKCGAHEDCELPFMYAARSNCPFQMKCSEEKCAVICPDYYDSEIEELRHEPQCSRDEDCDCGFYTARDKIDCVCTDGQCGAVVAR